MACNGNDGYSIVLPYPRTGLDNWKKNVRAYSQALQKAFVELPGALVHHSGSGGIRVLADFISRKHVGE